MLFPPPFPGYKYTIPSNRLFDPLRTRSGRPNPKSTSYTLNLGELPTATQLVPASLNWNMIGFSSHSLFLFSIAAASWPAIAAWIMPAANSGGFPSRIPVAVPVKIAWMRFPK
uniref:Uncharacterized protein n=1 Tax=Opuntia streptacantha TaxID=393608 RepID=A0A7C9A2A7_OPUST